MNRPIEELIYDRTLSDVTRKTNKGNYNTSDLNRVEKWCEYIAELLNEYGYSISITTKTDWKKNDLKNMTSHINRIKSNCEKIKEVFTALSTTPTTDTTKTSINYIDANNIEKILKDINYLIQSMESAFTYVGTSTTGNEWICDWLGL